MVGPVHLHRPGLTIHPVGDGSTPATKPAAGRIVHVLQPPHEADGFTSSSAPFAIGVAFTGQDQAVVGQDGRTRTLSFGPGTIGLNGPRPLTWLRTTEASESLEIVPSAEALARAAAEHRVRWEDLGRYQQPDDPVVWATAVRARRRVVSGTGSDEAPDDATEELVTHLLAHVAATYAGGRPTTPGRLDERRVRAVCERIHEAPFAGHPLHELAAVAHLSPHHFLRAFRRTVGLTPHRYAVAVRAEQARRLLARPGATVGGVAEQLGVEPRQLRRLHRGAIGASPRG